MNDEDAPLMDGSSRSTLDDVKMRNSREYMVENAEIFINLSEFEKKLLRTSMRSLVGILTLWLIYKKRQHGYEIMNKLQDFNPFDNKMPSASKIYPVLHDLEKNGFIKGTWEHHGKRKVKYYEIIDEGREVFSRFKKFAKHAKDNHAGIWVKFMEDMDSF